jgi:hypothetical protein
MAQNDQLSPWWSATRHADVRLFSASMDAVQLPLLKSDWDRRSAAPNCRAMQAAIHAKFKIDHFRSRDR